MKIRLVGTVIMVLTLAMMAQGATVTVIAQNGSGYYARDINNANLPAGSRIQLIAGGTAVEPKLNGDPGVGNTLLGSNTLNSSGSYCFSVDNVLVGSQVFVRVWNTTTWPPPAGTYYAHSAPHTVLDKAPLPDEWSVNQNIDTDYRIATTSSIAPTGRGQGAQGQLITIEGDYMQSGATVTFSGGSGISPGSQTCQFINANKVQAVISLATNATVMPWSATVTNPYAIASNGQTFAVNAGPHPATPSPSSYYRGDSGKTVIMDGTGFHSNALVDFSGNTDNKISYEVQYNSSTRLTLNNFKIYPSAASTTRTITVTNPSDAGRDTTSFTVADPTVNLLRPNEGYLGNFFTVTAEAAGTHFQNGTTTVALGSQAGKVIVGPTVTVIDPTHLRFTLTVSPDATTGAQAFTATTPNVVGSESEIEALAGAFNLTAPSLGTLDPATIYLGTTIDITVPGTVNGTHFRTGATTAQFSGSGVTVNSVTVNSPSSLTLNVTASTDATLGLRNLTVVTTGLDVGGTETVNKSNALNVAVPGLPGQVSDLRALSQPYAGTITLKWINPASNYSGARLVGTSEYAAWDSLSTDSPGVLDLTGAVSQPSTQELSGLSSDTVYYFKVFSYIQTAGKYFNPSGVKVAAVPMSTGGIVALSRPLTLETGVHGINHFSLPFPAPWYVNGVAIANAYDLVKAINTAAGSNVVSTFAKWVGPYAVETQGLEIAGRDPEPVRAELEAIPLVNGGGYQVYMTQPVTIIIRNTP